MLGGKGLRSARLQTNQVLGTIMVLSLLLFPGLSHGIDWLEAERLTFDTTGSLNPDVVVDPFGTVSVVWWDLRDGNNEIYCKRKPADGAWGADERLTVDPGSSRYPAVAVGPDGDLHVVWQDDRDGNEEIYYKHFDLDLETWSPDLRLTNAAGSSAVPSIVVGPSSALHLVWEERRDGNAEIYYRGFDGSSWSAEERLTTDPAESWLPRVAADLAGNVYVLWEDVRTAMPQIWSKRFDGAFWSTDEQLSSLPSLAGWPSVTVASDGVVHAVWWGAAGMDAGIYHRSYDGLSWSTEIRIADVDPHSSVPDLAASSNGAVHVVWDADPDGNQDLFHQTWNGESWSVVTQLTFDPDESWQPTIATSPDGEIHVTWYDDRDGGYEIYHQVGLEIPAGIEPLDVEGTRLQAIVTPNPSSGPFTFRWNRPGTTAPILHLYNLAGRLVRTVDGVEDRGDTGRATWDGRDGMGRPVDTGVYFYRLETGHGIRNGRVVVTH